MGSPEMTRTSAYKRSLKGTSPKKREQRRQLRVMQCRSSAGPCRDLPESSCALVTRDTLLCTSWPPGLCPLARATGLCMALLTIFLFSVCLCFVVSNLRDAIWVAFLLMFIVSPQAALSPGLCLFRRRCLLSRVATRPMLS